MVKELKVFKELIQEPKVLKVFLDKPELSFDDVEGARPAFEVKGASELWGGKPYTSRYIGSLVGDFHRTLDASLARFHFHLAAAL